MSREMRFKNYIDKKYFLYENANKDFYRSLTSAKRLKDVTALRNKKAQARVEQMHEKSKQQIPGYIRI